MGLEDSQICGLVGVAGYISQKEEAVFKRLLELDTTRGPHSTGVLAVDSRGSTEVLKKVGTPWDLYQYKQFDEILKASLCVLMGHNRWATKGKINATNAHPFEHSHIIGAHNGTLRNQSLLPNARDFEVDSDNIFYSLSTLGVDETIARTNGAFALTWYDSEQETMNFIRNEERPLWLCESEDRRTVFWASESWMLDITLQLAGIKHTEMYQPKSGQLVTYPIELAFVPKAFQEVKVRPVKLHEYPIYGGHSKIASTTVGNSGSGGKADANGNVFAHKAKESEKGKFITPNELVLQGDVEFFVSSLEETKISKQQYISCGATQDNCEIELRLYLEDEEVIKSMMLSVHLFTGRVRGFATVAGETWCTLDPRSIVELFNTEDDSGVEEEMAVVFGGEIVSESVFDLATLCGCGNCKTIPVIEESDELVWLDKQNFICGDCKDLPVVKDFIENAIKTGTH